MIFSLDFSVCEYVGVEFLFLFGETSANSLEMWYFLQINAKIFYVLSMLTVTNFRCSSSRCFLTYESPSHGFVCLDIFFCLCSVIFSFTLAYTFCFHGLKFEVVYLVLSGLGSIHVSRAVAISINALEKFIVRGSL